MIGCFGCHPPRRFGSRLCTYLWSAVSFFIRYPFIRCPLATLRESDSPLHCDKRKAQKYFSVHALIASARYKSVDRERKCSWLSGHIPTLLLAQRAQLLPPRRHWLVRTVRDSRPGSFPSESSRGPYHPLRSDCGSIARFSSEQGIARYRSLTLHARKRARNRNGRRSFFCGNIIDESLGSSSF